MSGNTSGDDRIHQALRLLALETRDRIGRHPFGHLWGAAAEDLDLKMTLPTSLSNSAIEKASAEVSAALESAVAALLSHRAVLRPGRVYCLRCRSADCEHSVPKSSREVFAGYGKTGAPRFIDFGQFLLERQDPRTEWLYGEHPRMVVQTVSGEELERELLEAFHDRETRHRIHGQVCAGWYRVPDKDLGWQGVAMTLQIVSSRPAGNRRRFGLNVIGLAPEGQPLEVLQESLGRIPWAAAARWAQGILDRVEHGAYRKRRGIRHVERRLQGLLQGLARRLEKEHRSTDRRTRHAQRRHTEGDRPTRKALADLTHAKQGDLLFDTRHKTVVVLGERGRAHVFSLQGKLVTSVRYSPESVARRRENGLWRQATPEEVNGITEAIRAQGST